MARARFISSLLTAAVLAGSCMFLSSCETVGGDPVGSLLTRTSGNIQQWRVLSYQFQRYTPRALSLGPGGSLLASMRDSGIFISNNNGVSWNDYSTGLPDTCDIHSIILAGDETAYAVSDTAAYRRSPAGGAWEEFTDGLSDGAVLGDLYKNPSGTLYLTSSMGMYALSSSGDTWYAISSGLPTDVPVIDLDFFSNGSAAALTSNGTIYNSANGVSGWAPIYLPFYVDSVYSLAVNPNGALCVLLNSRRLTLLVNNAELDPEQLLYAEDVRFYNGIGYLLHAQEKSTDPYSNMVRRYEMMRSIDGGLTWVPFQTGLSTFVVDMTFDAQGNGTALGADGTICRTINPVK